MTIPLEEHPYREELLRARQLSAAHDEMKWIISHVIVPEFKELIQVFIKHSYPWDIRVHGHGVIFNFGKPNKPFTIAYCGYPEALEFELAITADEVEKQEEESSAVEHPSEFDRLDLGLDDYFLSKSEPDENDLIDFGFDEFTSRYTSEEKTENRAITSQNEELGETDTRRIRFPYISPTSIRKIFESFLTEHAPELDYIAEYKGYELHDLSHRGPYQLRIADDDATSIIATVEEFGSILTMASSLTKTFRGKDLIITLEDGSLVC